jgi:hypothetical protein
VHDSEPTDTLAQCASDRTFCRCEVDQGRGAQPQEETGRNLHANRSAHRNRPSSKEPDHEADRKDREIDQRRFGASQGTALCALHGFESCREARAVIFSYVFGGEVRLLVGSQRDVVQTQVCRTQEEVLSTAEQWKPRWSRRASGKTCGFVPFSDR